MIQCLSQGVLYEQFTSWVVISLLRPGDIAVDVGAHVGFYTLLMRSLVGASGAVRAAEPERDSYMALLGNMARNGFGDIATIPSAISDRAGRAAFVQDTNNEGESRLATLADSSSLRVTTTTLDQWLQDLPRPARLLKLDAEGCELHILNGATEFFARQAPGAVICEINPTALNRYGASSDGLRLRFREWGYSCYLINVAAKGRYDLCDGAILKPLLDDERVDTNAVYNLLFCSPGVVPAGLGV
nr:FkbM family methyltransferase [Motiliproteus sediminis]